MAVDIETLSLLAEAGIQYTLLTGKQVHGATNGAGPYRVELPGRKSIAVFKRDDGLSSELSFNIHNLGGAGLWARNSLAHARKNTRDLTLLATAGETFGHHFAGEEQFLFWLLTHEALQAGYEVTTLDRYFVQNPPKQTVQIEERSSWTDHPGLSHWTTGYSDDSVDTTWKGTLRRALDNAASDIDRVYEETLMPYKVDSWKLRDAFLPALFAGATADEFIAEQVPEMKPAERETLKTLFQAQRLTQRMYNSYTFTDNALDGRQPRYAIACAATALTLAQQATGRDMNDRLPLDLAVVTSRMTNITGGDILREVLQEFSLELTG